MRDEDVEVAVQVLREMVMSSPHGRRRDSYVCTLASLYEMVDNTATVAYSSTHNDEHHNDTT